MSERKPTLFENLQAQHMEWDSTGRDGTPPVRYVYRGKDTSALVDIFPKLDGTIVVVPNEGAGEPQQYHEQRPSDLLKGTLTAQAVSHRMFARAVQRGAEDPRMMWHAEGYHVPDHPHVVLGVSTRRGEGKRLYEKVGPATDDQLNDTWHDTTLAPDEAEVLDNRIGLIDAIAPLLDGKPDARMIAALQQFVAQQLPSTTIPE